MNKPHPINRALLTVLENQVRRTQAALGGLPAEVFAAKPGGDCNSIQAIGRHLLNLRRFQLRLLESPLGEKVPPVEAADTAEGLAGALDTAADLFRQAVESHDPEDWYRVPDAPREGPWGDEPTLARLSRPLNDFTSHLGGIRAIRRIHGCGADATQ